MSSGSHNPPRASYSSTATHTNSSDASSSNGRRPSNKKENQFVFSHGSKLHAYGRDKAPYPCSYNREVLELSCIDHTLMLQAKQTVTLVDFKGHPPKRCLDLGTGLGDWVIDAAKRWPECTFVGYDLVNIQISLHYVEPEIAKRVQWVYGNILRQRLPFDDDEFDYIHLNGVAFAVPELKWTSVYEELNRVLRHGGVIEHIEEDAIFPILPRWFTVPLHAQEKRPATHLPDGSQRSLLPSTATSEAFAHDHALLEVLFAAVFENRFLNTLPTSVLPGYFTSIFSHVLSPPVLMFPMPPFAPLTPLPGELNSSSADLTNEEAEPSMLFLPDLPKESKDPRLSISSRTSESPSVEYPPTLVDGGSVLPTDPRYLDLRERSPSMVTEHSDMSGESTASASSPGAHRQSVAAYIIPNIHDRIGDESVVELLPTPEIASFEEHSLFMHLYRAVGMVLSVREAMWDELQEIVKRNPESLRDHGWKADDFKVGVSRQKFDALVERYKGDMHVRLSLWHSLTKQGWPYPQRDPLSKAELVEEERMRRAILEARKCATEEELKMPSRSLRLLVGMKGN